MKTTIKQLSDTKVELTIILAETELADASKVALSKLAKDIKVAGFRKGKVPLAIAEKNIDPNTLQDQALDDAISKAVATSFIENEIQALDRPNVEVKKYVPGETLEFTAEAEVLPKVILGDYKHLKSKVGSSTVSAKDVDEVVERIQRGFATKKEVTRVAKMDDETIIDFVGKKDGVAFDGGTSTDYALTLGSKSFIPGFEEGIVGHKIGETFDIVLKFPADYHVANLKSQEVTFTTTLKSISALELPKIDDEFASKAGPFKTVVEMKADIKRELKAQKEREAHENLKETLAQELAEVSKVPTPEALIHDQVHSLQRDVQQNLSYQGMTLEQYLEDKGMTADEWHDSTELREQAIKRVKIGLVLAELSKKENIQASSEELADHIELYRKQYANDPEALKQFEAPEVQRDVANRLLTEKTVERLVEINASGTK